MARGAFRLGPGRDARGVAVRLTPARLRAMSERSFHRWLLPALAQWTFIAALFSAGFAIDHGAAWAVVVVLLGSRQHALGVLGHDSAHFTAARSRRLNDVSAEVLCFWPLLTGLDDFRRFHFRHHQHFSTHRDPELVLKHRWSRP